MLAGSKDPRHAPTRSAAQRLRRHVHHGGFHVYYREASKQVRRRVADNYDDAARIAAQINGQLAAAAPTLLAFEPISVAGLRRRFLAYHEDVRRSSLATVKRYRAATQHLENFAADLPAKTMGHELRAEQFVAYLRRLEVHPNGHSHTPTRPLRDKGLQFILEVCRSLYAYAAKQRHLPPYAAERLRGVLELLDRHTDNVRYEQVTANLALARLSLHAGRFDDAEPLAARARELAGQFHTTDPFLHDGGGRGLRQARCHEGGHRGRRPPGTRVRPMR